MSFTLVCLPSAASSAQIVYNYAQATEDMVLTKHAGAPLTLLPSVVKTSQVLLIVPIHMLSWHIVALPRGVGPYSPRLRAVLDSLLEEHLLDEPDQVHLALAPGPLAANLVPAGSTIVDKTERYWVAACDKSWLRSHIHALESVGIEVGRIVPEFDPNPLLGADPVKLHLLGEIAQPMLVATGSAVAGVVLLPMTDLQNTPVLQLLPAAGTNRAVGRQMVFAEPALAAMAENLFGNPVSIKSRQQRWLESCGSSWELAQFDLVSTGRTRLFKRISEAARQWLYTPQWRLVRWGLAGLLVVNLLGLNVSAWKERSTQQAQRTAIRDTLTQTFPQVKVIIDAPLQMQREVAVLRQASGAASTNGLEAVLAVIGNTPLAAKGPSALEMSNGNITIKGLELSAQAASGLSTQLKALSYDASINGDVLRITAARLQNTAP